MSQRRRRLLLAAEVGWLVLSTAVFAILAVQEPGSWRAAWLAMLVVNAAVVGYRIRRMWSPRADVGQAPT